MTTCSWWEASQQVLRRECQRPLSTVTTTCFVIFMFHVRDAPKSPDYCDYLLSNFLTAVRTVELPRRFFTAKYSRCFYCTNVYRYVNGGKLREINLSRHPEPFTTCLWPIKIAHKFSCTRPPSPDHPYSTSAAPLEKLDNAMGISKLDNTKLDYSVLVSTRSA
jgi:hypothetical protein